MIMTKGIQRLRLDNCFFIVVWVMCGTGCGGGVVQSPLIVTGESQNGKFDGAVMIIECG